MKSLVLIFQFLTKLPINIKIDADKKDFSKGIIWFPLVGLVIGLLLAGLYYISSLVFSTILVSVIIVVFEIFITGGLHLDGLADSFDGLYSYRDKDRMLEIMKDSRIGANGVIILILNILIKVFLINEFNQDYIYYALILMPVVSRFTTVFLSRFSYYARKNGMGGFFIGETSTKQFVIALIMTLLFSMIYYQSILILIVIIIITIIFRNHVYKKIDGITGDILGAWVELSEVLYLIFFLILVNTII